MDAVTLCVVFGEDEGCRASYNLLRYALLLGYLRYDAVGSRGASCGRCVFSCLGAASGSNFNKPSILEQFPRFVEKKEMRRNT